MIDREVFLRETENVYSINCRKGKVKDEKE